MRPRFDSAAIAAVTGGSVLRPGPAGPVTANSQTLAPGEWFVALAGDGFDDHAFVPEAAKRGAAGVVVSRPPDAEVAAVLVPDTWAALRDLGRAARRRFDGPVVAITGSTGKTTTRALTALALSPLGPIHQTEENQNHEPGVPLTLLSCPEAARAQVIELGTAGPGQIERLVGVVEPSVRVLVNVGPAHLAQLGGLDGVAAEKAAIYASARPGDTCVVNLDDSRVAGLPLPHGTRRIGFGAGGDVELIEVELLASELATRATWRTPSGTVTARLPSPAPHVARNAAAAIAVAWACGVTPSIAAEALEAYVPVGRRLRIERLPCGATVFDDAFNANPGSVSAALRMLASLPGRRAAIVGDMLDLGDDEARFHLEVVSLARGLGLDLLVLVGTRMEAARHAAPGAWWFGDAAEAGAAARGWVRSGDHVLVKGSRGMRMERALSALHG